MVATDPSGLGVWASCWVRVWLFEFPGLSSQGVAPGGSQPQYGGFAWRLLPGASALALPALVTGSLIALDRFNGFKHISFFFN